MLRIYLPPELRRFVDSQIRQHSYISAGEYIRALIREDMRRSSKKLQDENAHGIDMRGRKSKVR